MILSCLVCVSSFWRWRGVRHDITNNGGDMTICMTDNSKDIFPSPIKWNDDPQWLIPPMANIVFTGWNRQPTMISLDNLYDTHRLKVNDLSTKHWSDSGNPCFSWVFPSRAIINQLLLVTEIDIRHQYTANSIQYHIYIYLLYLFTQPHGIHFFSWDVPSLVMKNPEGVTAPGNELSTQKKVRRWLAGARHVVLKVVESIVYIIRKYLRDCYCSPNEVVDIHRI